MNGAQNTQVQQLLSQLADISGLDKISWWPLAPGWWGLIVLFMLILAAGMFLVWHRRAYRNSWKHDANETLTFMEAQLEEINARAILLKLSDVLRRIAIRRFSRAECAGLKGNEWVEWLTRNDPDKFDWREYENFLTEIPYSPPDYAASMEKIRILINATRKWVQ